jgi:hypothetical protein
MASRGSPLPLLSLPVSESRTTVAVKLFEPAQTVPRWIVGFARNTLHIESI